MAERRREILPIELAALVDVAERPRAHGWSLRAALTRYAQPQPMRVSKLLDEVRRLESALAAHTDDLRRDGPELWAALEAGSTDLPTGGSAELIGLLAAAVQLDGLSDLLATWAVAREGERPDVAVDAVTADLAARLDALGIPHEDRLPPPARRRG